MMPVAHEQDSQRGRQIALVAAAWTFAIAACSTTSPGGGAGPILFGDSGAGQVDSASGADASGSDGGAVLDTLGEGDLGPGDGGAGDTGAGEADADGADAGEADAQEADAGQADAGGQTDDATTAGDGEDAGSITDGIDDSAADDGGGVADGEDPGDSTDPSDVSDGAGLDAIVDAGGDGKADSGGGSDPFGDDVPWGSSEDAAPYDAGPITYPDGGAGGVPAPICTPKVAELNLKEEKVGGKVDVIWWIDTSGSMGQEAKYLNDNINKFANFIAAANVDFRMLLIGADTSCCKLCIQPPLGGPGCSDGPQFQHKKILIYSNDGPAKLIQNYAQWSGFLRPDATKNFVAVTDDNQSTPPTCTQQCSTANGGPLGQVCSQCKAQWFIDELQKLDPGNFLKTPTTPHGFVYHSIVAYDSAADCPTIAQKGAAYLELTAMTNGAKHKICLNDWAPIFQQLAQAVIQTAKPGCDYKIPFPPGVKPSAAFGMSYVAKDDLFNVPKAPGNVCPFDGSGFVIDNPASPTQVTLCPASCDLLKGGGNIQFDFGCF